MTLADEVNEMIAFALLNAEITSAGGDSPKINRIITLNNLKQADLEQQIADVNKGGSGGIPETGAGKFGISDAPLALRATGGEGLESIIGKFAGGAAAAAGPLAAAFVIPQLIPLIVEELTRPGGFMDKRVKIVVQDEALGILERQTRQNIRIGDQQVIIQQVQGFRASEGYHSTNTLELVRENADRVTDIGLFDRAEGLPLGGK